MCSPKGNLREQCCCGPVQFLVLPSYDENVAKSCPLNKFLPFLFSDLVGIERVGSWL